MTPKVSHSLVQTLRAIPDFADLDERSLLKIVGESMNLFWNEGSPIFEPGSPGDALYVVISGEAGIYDGKREIAKLEAGDFFGELSLLLNATHSKTARAITDCEILVLPKESFHAILEETPSLAAHFEEVLRTRLPRVTPEPVKTGLRRARA